MRISVVTATYNCADTVVHALDSVASQRDVDIEHLVIDGGSRDGTVDLLNARRGQLAHLVSEPDRGIYDALNKGIARARGDVVGFLHADDVYADARVLADVAAAFADPAVQAVYGDLQYVQQNDPSCVIRHWQAGEFSRRRLAWGWMPPHPSLYVRRSWYERIGGFDTRYRIAADYFSILQLFSAPDFRAVYLPRVLVQMRLGGASNRSLSNILRKSREDLDALRRSGVGGVGALFWKNASKLGQFVAGPR
jgi:glycosyltransferase involved in cell wall biosynthesis